MKQHVNARAGICRLVGGESDGRVKDLVVIRKSLTEIQQYSIGNEGIPEIDSGGPGAVWRARRQ